MKSDKYSNKDLFTVGDLLQLFLEGKVRTDAIIAHKIPQQSSYKYESSAHFVIPIDKFRVVNASETDQFLYLDEAPWSEE
jgi:hypothetical protein